MCSISRWQTDKKTTETGIRTNRGTSKHTNRRALEQKRGKKDKTEAETRSRRQQTRIKTQDGRQGRWCSMMHTATRGWVVVWRWCCFVVCCCSDCVLVPLLFEWWPPPFSSLEVAVCPPPLNLSFGGQDTRVPGTPRGQTGGQHWARLVCSTFILETKLN